MGRRYLIPVAAITLSVCCAVPAFGQGGNGKNGRGKRNAVRERLSQMSPHDRQIFRRNAEYWRQLSPEHQMSLRQRETIRRQQVQKEAEAALRESGVNLDPARRNVFEERYLAERRRMERALRQEMEAKRRQQINELLKRELQSHRQNSPASSANPSASAPKK